MAMIAFSILCDIYKCRQLTRPLEMAGQNPMIAYVATNLVVMPVLNLIGVASYLSYLQQNAWLGFLRGIIITTLAALIAIIFTKLKWFWRNMKLLIKKITCVILILCSYCSYGEAKIQLPSILGNGMVLQQKSEVKLWGKATPNKKVVVYTSWNAQQQEVDSNQKGDWSVAVTTPEAGGPYTIRISDGEELILDDVLIGEVWLCSGQSNMEMPVKGFRGQPAAESQNTIVNANSNRSLRLFTVQRAYSSVPQENVAGQWERNTPKSVSTFSAVAYYYGDQLQKVLGIPVGLIHASWSGSSIEPWISKENLLQFPEIDLTPAANPQSKYANGTPTVLYNAMIKPLENYNIKGMIWYQGESNSARPEQYQRLFAVWAKQNRTLFRSKDFPIYYTEIAPVASPVDRPFQRAIFREAQLESMYEISNTGMAFTNDLGSEKFIHAPQK